MDTKTILKWGVILVVAWIAWNWIDNFIANQNYTPGELYSAPYAAPLLPPAPAALGWVPPWGYGLTAGSRRGRPRPQTGAYVGGGR